MSRLAVPIVALSLLAGCNSIKLTDIAQAACAAQAAANLAGQIAERQGNPAMASGFAEASRIAGFACAW